MRVALVVAGAIVACGGSEHAQPPPGMVVVAGGAYTVGSDATERERGYALSPPAVRTGAWYDRWERDPVELAVEPFAIDRTPVTQAAYAAFVAATRRDAPYIDSLGYQAQGFLVHAYAEVRPFLWHGATPPEGLDDHPVVLVSRHDAAAYCAWRGQRDGLGLRLPTEREWEAACRGGEGRTFPWGDTWREGAIQAGATFTAPVDMHPDGATPEGVSDLAGNVFEWVDATMPDGRAMLKGCSWDDAPGTCRCAFRHGRPGAAKHILIGFRCAMDG